MPHPSQDVEYKFSGFFKLLQSHCGSAFYAHGAVSLWRRELLGREILFEHDTAFHGEDLYMGLLLHRHNSPSSWWPSHHCAPAALRTTASSTTADDKAQIRLAAPPRRIATSGAHAVETYAPDDFLTLFRQALHTRARCLERA